MTHFLHDNSSNHLSTRPASDRHRVLSLDGLRGLSVFLMLFTINIGPTWPLFNLAPWNGITIADFIQPFFLFAVGFSLVLSMSKYRIHRTHALKHAIKRCLKLCLIGILTEGGSGESFANYNLKYLRLLGILQRIAICYIFGVLLELYLAPAFRYDVAVTPTSSANRLLSPNQNAAGCRQRLIRSFSVYRMYQYHWIIFLILCGIYMSIVYGVRIPSSFNNTCHTTDLSPPCNPIGYVDKYILGANHMYFPINSDDISFQRTAACSDCSPGKCLLVDRPTWCNNAVFDPYGVVSTFPSICTTICGMHVGHLIINFNDNTVCILHLIVIGLIQLFVGLLLEWSGFNPLNANLYSISYLFVTAGAAALVLSVLYWFMDVQVSRYRFTKKYQKCRRLHLAEQYLNNFISSASNKSNHVSHDRSMEDDVKRSKVDATQNIQASFSNYNDLVMYDDDDDADTYSYDDDTDEIESCCPFWCCCCCEMLPVARWDWNRINVVDRILCLPLESLGRNAFIIYVCAVSNISDWIFTMFYWNDDRNQCIQNYLWPTGVLWGPTDDNAATNWLYSNRIMVWTLAYCLWWTAFAILLNYNKKYCGI
eukprot:197639_1